MDFLNDIIAVGFYAGADGFGEWTSPERAF
jgi:hypothetical protein